jgi:hypothetical protein
MAGGPLNNDLKLELPSDDGVVKIIHSGLDITIYETDNIFQIKELKQDDSE